MAWLFGCVWRSLFGLISRNFKHKSFGCLASSRFTRSVILGYEKPGTEQLGKGLWLGLG